MKNIGQAFCEMGFAIKEERPIFVKIGMNYDVSCRLWNSHVNEEWQPLFDLLLEYRALLTGWHSLLGKVKKDNKIFKSRKKFLSLLLSYNPTSTLKLCQSLKEQEQALLFITTKTFPQKIKRCQGQGCQ